MIYRKNTKLYILRILRLWFHIIVWKEFALYMNQKDGTTIKDAIEEKDSDTLFPLQAALGYDIAQNLFINKNNLLVEGVSDLVYLTVMSSILEESGLQGIKDEITIVPVGGLDKVTSFISLLRGQNLNIVCALDNFTDQKGKARLNSLIEQKIIKEKMYFSLIIFLEMSVMLLI